MICKLSLINAFTKKEINFRGNPCAVILLDKDLQDEAMQTIANDLNQPATTFLLHKEANVYAVRWFAPDQEIELCGHGSLASTSFLLSDNQSLSTVKLLTKTKQIIEGVATGQSYSIKLAKIVHSKMDKPTLLEEALGVKVIEYYETSNKHLVVLENEDALKNMKPDFGKLRDIDVFGYAVTAKSDEESVDFVSRTLVPHVKQLEDHATGSSHAALLPYWQQVLGKNTFIAKQFSPRGGYFETQIDDDYVHLAGNTDVIFEGNLKLD